ncbi:MAG: hypothetical protein QNJ65_12120 [Xenococcaceae cyanobacterium MO_234.B1]|nr:hypothetical protein [Xenococcaceae cyanobacterium MO_234.B1]
MFVHFGTGRTQDLLRWGLRFLPEGSTPDANFSNLAHDTAACGSG